MLEKFYLRRPMIEDKQTVLDLMLRCDIRDVGQPDSDMADLNYDWSQMDLGQDAWIALDGKGALRGYGAVLPWSCGRRLAIYDDPGTEHDDLFLGLLLLCEGRATRQLADLQDESKRMLITHVADAIDYQNKTLSDAGYAIRRHIFNMHIDLDQDIHEPRWPEGVTLRNAQTGIDDEHIHAVIQKAFEKPDHPEQTFDEWQEFMMRADLYQSDLWFLAVSGDEIVGTCLCFPYENMGWVRQLAVRQDFRQRGLGSALLLQAFRAFRQLDYDKVGLAVESHNEHACRLYERVGMRQIIHLNEYGKDSFSQVNGSVPLTSCSL